MCIRDRTGNDEISEVADAFYTAVMQIKKLNESRQLFLRNIMHELKTPITKGRITAEMIPEDKYQKRLISVFEKLEELINEFAAVEEATSGKKLNIVDVYLINELIAVSYTHLRAHETVLDLVCRLLL